jgi:hypothetical protein
MLQEPLADLRVGPSAADLVLERLPNGEFAWLRPEPEYRVPSDPGGRALAIDARFERCPDGTRAPS